MVHQINAFVSSASFSDTSSVLPHDAPSIAPHFTAFDEYKILGKGPWALAKIFLLRSLSSMCWVAQAWHDQPVLVPGTGERAVTGSCVAYSGVCE